MSAPSLPPIGAIVGPTASGKSALAVEVALVLGRRGHPSEIVNADSMAVYRGMDIGTAKPDPGQLAAVRHHLVDISDPAEPASVAGFQELARATIEDLRRRGITPLLVGGSALYTRAVLDEMDFPGTDPAVRARWQERLERIGAPALHAELAERHPAAAAGIEPGNGRRIVRALEVIELTGDFRATLPEPRYALTGVHQFGLELDRQVMDERIEQRVRRMWQLGLVDEVRELAERGLRAGPTASRALGYRQVLDHLDGLISEDQALEATVSGTRRFARKQFAWWRRDPRIDWLPAGDPSNPERVADLLWPEVSDRPEAATEPAAPAPDAASDPAQGARGMNPS